MLAPKKPVLWCRSTAVPRPIGRRLGGPRPVGFTLIELMVTLAVAAVLVGFALPAFNDFTAQRNLTARVNSLVLAVNYARSEAARLGTVVSVQAVDASDAGNEWGNGYCVVVGNPGDCTGTTLRQFEPVQDATFDGVNDFDGVGALSFNSRGMMVNGVAGSLQLCSTITSVEPGREIDMNLIGRTVTEDLVCN